MGGQEDLNELNESDKPTEAGEASDRPQVDSITALEERVEIAKGDESYTKQKKFTLGDGGFSIVGLEKAEHQATGLATKRNDAAGEQGHDGGDLKYGKPIEPGKETDTKSATVMRLPDGGSNTVEYDKDGKPVKIAHSEQTTWEKQPDGSWKQFGRYHADELQPSANFKDIRDVKLMKDGSVVATAADKSTLTTNPDGSRARADAAGNVVEIVAANGKKTEIPKYEDGKPALIMLPDGQTLDKQADGTWQRFNPDGTGGEPFAGDVTVAKDGTVTFKSKDNSTEVRNTDGSVVKTDKDGHVTQLVKTDGKVRNMTYADGKLVQVDMSPDGSMKKEGNEWVTYNERGMETNRHKAELSYTKDGTRIIKTQEGELVSERDGSGKKVYQDHTQVVFDKHKNVTEIVDPDGKRTNITYGRGPYGELKPVEIADKDGSTWKKEDDGWHQYRNGKATGDAWTGSIGINEDGDITRGTKDGKWVETRHADGSITRGADPRETRDRHGQVTQHFYASEHGNRDTIISYKNGQLSAVEVGPNYTWKQLPDGRWQKEVGGEEPGPPQDVKLTVTANGDLMVTTKGGKPLETAHRDGTVTKYNPDGSKVRK